ncbi:MAG TPA: acyl-CoA dehydrogenase family protein [Actinomycetota bacterium]
MEFAFNDQQEALRSSVREVLAERSTSAAVRAAMDSKTGTDPALWAQVAELGWPGVAIEETYGGLGLGLIELAIIHEELGRTTAPVPYFSTVGLALQVAGAAPAGAARDALLGRIAAGGTATLVLGQKDGRFDAAGVNVKAERTGDGWRFTGTASLAPEAHLAADLVVVARTERSRVKEKGLSVFVVPATALKSKPKPQPSLDGTRRLADVRLGGVEVPAGALISPEGEGWPVVEAGLLRAAVLLAAEAVGVCERVLELSVAYAKEREQFGRPIGSFQAISHRCADMLLSTETARSHVYYAAWALEEGATDQRLAAATAKAAAAEAAHVVPNGGIQVHGGIGFTWEHDMHLYYRRAKFCELFLGDAAAWRERVTTELVAAEPVAG